MVFKSTVSVALLTALHPRVCTQVADLREWISSVPGIDEAIALSTVRRRVMAKD